VYFAPPLASYLVGGIAAMCWALTGFMAFKELSGDATIAVTNYRVVQVRGLRNIVLFQGLTKTISR